MGTIDQPDLLFIDTFSHDTNEGLNLDLVQFPKSVYVREIRIIPLGARVEGEFPGGVRLGATNPTKFHIDFFVNDLSKPGASTFEAIGSLDYCQNGQIHMECSSTAEQTRIPTDGLVLRGWYTTITLAVYGNLTQVIAEPLVVPNPPAQVQRQVVPTLEVAPVIQEPPPVEWIPEATNPIPTYTGNIATTNPEAYAGNYAPENYEAPIYRAEYYEAEPPKDPRSFHQEDTWEKRRHSVEREPDRRLSPRSIELDRDRRHRLSRSRSPKRRDRSLDRRNLRSKSRSIDRDYVVKGEYRPLSRSRSRSVEPRERLRALSADRDWDRSSYKREDYRRHRETSYDRSPAGSYDKRSGSFDRRSPYDKRRTPSYDRKSYEKRAVSPYDRAGSYERRGPSYEKQSPYDKKRHSPYRRVRGSSYGSRSPSRDDPRKRPRSPPGERRPLSPRDIKASPARSDDEYDRSGKLIPRVEFYHQSYRHKSCIRSPSQEPETAPFIEPQHPSLVTVKIVDNPSVIKPESPDLDQEDDKSMEVEQFEPILSDEDICDDNENAPYMDVDYDSNDYTGADDIIKYFNPFKSEWKQYEHVNKVHLLATEKRESVKDVLTATFDDLCDVNSDLFKIYEITRTAKGREQKFIFSTFTEIDNISREEWVHQCEQIFVALTNLCRQTDIILRIFNDKPNFNEDEFTDIFDLLITFCKIGLNFDYALSHQQPTYKIRHMKCGIRLSETLLNHKYNGQVMKLLLKAGIDVPMLLLQMYAKEYMALSIRLMILKSLNACLASKESVEHFMRLAMYPKFVKNEDSNERKNGYQALISIMKSNPLARIKFSISALIKKMNMYELLAKLFHTVTDFNRRAAENKQTENVELTEDDVELIVSALEEIVYMYRSHCFHISQPKRFLPVSAQFDINKDCSNEILLQFFEIHQTLEVCLFLLTCPSTCNNLVVISPIHDFIHELIFSENGLKFLYNNMEISELLFKTLIHPYGQQNTDDFICPLYLTNYTDLQVMGLELAYRLKCLYYLHSIGDHQAGKFDENELTDRLQALYCLTFGSIGKIAVPDVIAMGDNAQCLLEVFEKCGRIKTKSDSPQKQRSPAKGYTVELIVNTVRFSSNVPFLKKYGTRLLNVAKEHDRFEPSVSSVLQELIPYLKPIEKPGLLSGDDMAECIEILKATSEHAADVPGELMTCLRILRHYCISDYDANVTIASESATEEYVELKYKYNVLQLFSLDGVANLTAVLDRFVTRYEQPSVHSATFVSTKGLQIAQMIIPCIKLVDDMLARVVKSRGSSFRDMTAAPILLKTFGLLKAFPEGCVGYRTAMQAAEATVKALLAYSQPIADDANDGDSIKNGPWTSLCSQVISYTMTAPYTFVSGLSVFSEILPLPLPMQTKIAPTERELADAANERRLWSAHLHVLSNDLTDLIQVICMSTYRPVVHLLRRVCVQIADLAPNTASTVAKAAIGAVTRELKPGEAASGSLARVLSFLACLVAHAPVKSAVLYLMNTQGPHSTELQNALIAVLTFENASNEHAAAQEYAAHALAGLCDAEVTLTSLESPVEVILANSLPNKESLQELLEASTVCLEFPTKTCTVASSVLRTFFVLTEYEYGFLQFRKFVTKKRDALGKFFKWCLEGTDDGKMECLNLYVDLIKILRIEEGEGPMGRKSVLNLSEMADMVGFNVGDTEHPVLNLENLLKERNLDDEAVGNAHFLVMHLQKLGETVEAVTTPPPELAEMTLPPPDSLVRVWAGRAGRGAGGAGDERLGAAYWLRVRPAAPDAASDLASVCVLSLSRTCGVAAGAAGWLPSALAALTHSSTPAQAAALECRAAAAGASGAGAGCAGVGCAGGAGGAGAGCAGAGGAGGAGGGASGAAPGADSFRSRPPNTSRPPSLHVDHFTQLHHNNRAGRRGASGAAGGGERGRFLSPHVHYRHFGGRGGGGAWDASQHFGHFNPHYNMGGMGWGGGRMQRGPRHRVFMR